jgi:hypothetical protein
MFIYSCAHSLAKVRNENYCISNLSDLKVFRLSKNENLTNYVKYTWFRISSKFTKYDFHHFQDNRLDYSKKMLQNNSKNNWYYGYFQGENYFYENKLEIKKRFQIKPKYKESFEKLKNKIIGQSKYAIVHIRLKDYKTFGPDFLNGPDLTVPMAYYHNLIKKLPSNIKVIFLSDDIKKVKNDFSYVNNAYFSENSVIDDLQFIINANICVLSCSTFSWWGAWLNKQENLEVYVPKCFLGFKVKKEYPVNIIPKNWKQIEIHE